jgi:chemotaxis protein MotB
MKRTLVVALAAVFLGGCVSIATHEEEMRRCRAAAANAEDMTARATALEKENGDLKNQLAGKSAQLTDVQKTYDELQNKLKADVSKGDVGVSQSNGNVTITLGDKVLFQSGQWELQPRGRQVLVQVADVLKKVEADKEIQVEGHTDNVKISGTLKSRFPSNWDLSSARAAAVVRYLQEQGVDGGKLVLTAFGDTRPVADNTTADGRRLNRRVEIAIVPKRPAPEKKP